jgi:pimeloyl-ACP methyl ester carboxylesterase
VDRVRRGRVGNRRVLDRQNGPIVLVGYSYGASIITVAGTDPKVKALVYVAALQPDVLRLTQKGFCGACALANMLLSRFRRRLSLGLSASGGLAIERSAEPVAASIHGDRSSAFSILAPSRAAPAR